MAGRDLDARTYFFYMATVNTPKMAARIPGKGSQYAVTWLDEAGNGYDGAKNYKVNIPANVPAKDFWSVVLYDPQTRSELQTSQPFPSKNNKRDKLITNADGSVDLYFGPKAPCRQGSQLDCDRARQGLVRDLPAVWPARSVVRQALAAGRDRSRRAADARIQQQDPRADPDARQSRNPDRNAQFRGWRANHRDHAEGL